MAGLNDHKSKLMLMLGKPSKDEPEAEPEEDAGNAGLQAAMEDLLSAIAAKDPAAMAEAWQNAEACGSYEGPAEEEG